MFDITLEDIRFVIDQVEFFLEERGFRERLKQSEDTKTTLDSKPQPHFLINAQPFYKDLANDIQAFDFKLWSDKEIEIFNKLGFNEIFLENEEINILYALSSVGMTSAKQAINKINMALKTIFNKIESFKAITSPFIDSTYTVVDENKATIVITFDNGVAIDNFKDAKEQMSDWYLIIEGYARLLNLDRKEFEIVKFSKNSPTQIQVKVNVDVAKIILNISLAISMLSYTHTSDNRQIDSLENNPNIAFADKENIIKGMRENLESSLNKKIEDYVNQQMAEHANAEQPGDVKPAMIKSVKYQIDFINHGGTVI